MKIRHFFRWLIILLVIVLLIFVLRLGRSAWLGYQSGMQAKEHAELAWQAIQSGDLSEAHNQIEQADQDLSSASQHIKVLYQQPLLSKWPWYYQQVSSLHHLFKAGQSASQLVLSFLDQAQQWQDHWPTDLGQVSLEDITADNLPQIIDQLKEIRPTLLKTLASINQLETNLAQVEFVSGLDQLNAPVQKIRESLKTGKDLLVEYSPWLQLAPYLANQLSDGRFLLILQNNDELRPTGGFVGNYGVLHLVDGKIAKLETHDSYHLDMPAQDYFKPEPPVELNKYLGVKQWFFRDANWSPDWPTSARQLSHFYHEQTKVIEQTEEVKFFNGVIAITPTLIEDLLGLVGPIMVEDQAYDQNNFVELLQYRVEMSYEQYGVNSWDRKAVINDLISVLMKRLTDLSPDRWSEVLRLVLKNLDQKNILLFSYDPVVEYWLVKQNWAGQARSFSGDFLWIIDANLAAYKTDAVVDKHTSYRLYQVNDQWLVDLSLTYQHHGGFDWRTTRYQTYTRVYVPLGSQLISHNGFKENPVVDQDLSRTVFGGFIVVEPKQTKTVKLTYQLPATIAKQLSGGQYQLLLQKQPGRQRTSLDLDLQFNRPVQKTSSDHIDLQVNESVVKGKFNWLTDGQLLINF